MKLVFVSVFSSLLFLGCNKPAQPQKPEPSAARSSSAAEPAITIDNKQYIFPAKSDPFPANSVALDTVSGLLCKTYPWEDNDRVPKGLLLCSRLGREQASFCTGAFRAYSGFFYYFDGTRWNKAEPARVYNSKTHKWEPRSDDQYDRVGLFIWSEKQRQLLRADQIQEVANTFGVSYDEAATEAKKQGYQVPPKH